MYGLTELPSEEGVVWYKRPGPLAIVVGVMLHRAELPVLVTTMDLRVPYGLVFSAAWSNSDRHGQLLQQRRAPLTTMNVNLYAGLVMAIFGGWMLWLSKRTS